MTLPERMSLRIGKLACRLVFNRLRGELHRFSVDREVTRIGASADCEVHIVHPFISREHCRLIRSEGCFMVRDTGSAGGIYVNGDKVAQAELWVGDQLYFGGSVLFHFEHRSAEDRERDGEIERHPLAAAICADPQDDSARLAYADWLSRRGDPRGEFIRCQVHAAVLPAEDPRRAAMETSAQALLDRHELAWVQPLPMFVERWRFDRGFLSEVRLDARAILDSEDFVALRRAHPIRTVDFITNTLTPELREQLAASSRLDGLTW